MVKKLESDMVKNRKLRRDEESGLLLIDRPEDVPDFSSDEEEVAFWDTHAFSERFWKKAKHLSLEEIIRQGSVPVAGDAKGQ